MTTSKWGSSASGASTTFFGLYELIGELTAHEQILGQEIGAVTKEAIHTATLLAAEAAPFDTGALHDDILDSEIVEIRADEVYGEFGTTLDYGWFQEYGAPARNIPPKWFFRKAYEQVYPPWAAAVTALGGLP